MSITDGRSATVAVERMRWWHIDEVVALERELFPTDSWTAEQFWQELALPTRHYAVARAAEQVVGYAGIFVLAPDSDLQTLAVARAQQGQGTGRALLQWAIAEARSAGGRDMMLEVRSDNIAAIALYSGAGFTRISTRRHYYPDGGDADVMRLRIASPT